MDIFGKFCRLALSVRAKYIKSINVWLYKIRFFTKLMTTFILLCVYVFALHRYSNFEGNGFQTEIDSAIVLSGWYTLFFFSFLYFEFILKELLQLLLRFGWRRLLLFILSISVFSFVFVTIPLDKFVVRISEKLTDAYLYRFDNNTMTVVEKRPFFEKIQPYPFSDDPRTLFHGVPMEFHQIHRYLMEDAEFNCTVLSFGNPGGHPVNAHVQWHRNGVPLTMTDTHSQVITFKELPRSDPRQKETNMQIFNLSLYEVKSILKIFLLQENDFGSYTCHASNIVTVQIKDENDPTTPRGDKPTKTRKSTGQCHHFPDTKHFFQDSVAHKHEFRLIRVKESQEQIIAPPSSILIFQTSYWHLSPSSDVQMEYAVNGVSFPDLCDEGFFHSCSAVQRLWARFIHDPHTSWRLLWSLPVLHRQRQHLGDVLSIAHCLCANSFGRHSVTSLRKYYNRTSGQFQLFEITHPHTLLVRPPDTQSMSSYFANMLNLNPIRRLAIEDYLPEYAYHLVLLKDFAVAAAMVLHFSDVVIIVLGFCLLLFMLWLIVLILAAYGQMSKRLCFYGSLSYFTIARLTLSSNLQRLREGGSAARDNFYDFYLCYPETDIARSVITERVIPLLERDIQLKVCFRDRDFPPNMFELTAMEQAITNSKRFIVFLSEELLQDPCRSTEIMSIMETCWDRSFSPLDILVVKLSSMETPAWMRKYDIHDWTAANLTWEDNLLRLMRWVAPGTGHSLTEWSRIDRLLIVVPTVCIPLFLAIISRFL